MQKNISLAEIFLFTLITCLILLCVSCSSAGTPDQLAVSPSNRVKPEITTPDKTMTPNKDLTATVEVVKLRKTLEASKPQVAKGGITPTSTPTTTHTLIESPFFGEGFVRVPGKVKPPIGLLYRSESSLWLVNKNEFPTKIYDYNATVPEYFPSEEVKVSPDWRYIVTTSYTGIDDETKIIDIATGKIIQFFNKQKGDLPCGLNWWNERPDYMYGLLLHPSASLGYACRGGAALIRRNGEIVSLQNLPDKYEDGGLPSVASDGKRIAFSDNGKPWVFEFGVGKYRLHWKSTDLLNFKDVSLYYPSWSPSMKKIAWVFIGKDDTGNIYSGIAIIDLITGIARYIYPYDVGNWEGGGTNIHWVGDEKYIYVYAPGFTTNVILSVTGEEVIGLPTDYPLLWNSSGTVYTFVNPENRTVIGYLTGKEYVVIDGHSRVWSPDGKWLVIGNSFSNKIFKTYLLKEYSRELYEVDIPPDAIVLDWLTNN